MAPSTTKSNGNRSKKEMDFGGLDPVMMMRLMNQIPRNPVTGTRDLTDITKYCLFFFYLIDPKFGYRYMEEHPEEMAQLMAEYNKSEASKPKLDLSTYDYNALISTILPDSFWVVQLEHMGHVDKFGNPVEPNKVNTAPNTKPVFTIYCYDEQGHYRIMDEVTGLPDSKAVLRSIQRAIAEPIMPLKPGLPKFLMIAFKLTPHAETLKQFLDSIPQPFYWRFETRDEAQGVRDGVHDLNEQGVKDSMALAEHAKLRGNQAFSRKDRDSALKSYAEALRHIVDVLSQRPGPEEKTKATRLRAICYANRAATHMLPGTGQDPQKALADGKSAETVDPTYGKRQAAANEALGNKDDALDAIARGLRRKELENDVGLVDRLIELMTDGKGLSDDEETYKNWWLDVSINDARSSERLRGIQGEWKKRCAAQLEKWI
ncbi:Small glutamine-rich tetratricopeptide repeat-containing protein 2 [Psilocybe cubensis]|uniref:Small glutamine-rich tetratricopeptide repeat-containing protein 2 n=2 Tax=Psilocybe cubensis TaxID=181762 RepID=A0ACB8H7P8_PSICU|nr:Small glutamine-rich tetratricopeptide repeat-containing protein 2 [Psilocybe cubensis]KAH9483734.1 Small glutamine-rich tetratricopeptide repeat-containing protein 2 [Psilocybe cubensis]